MPPKKRKRGGQHKLPPALRKAQEAARDAKAAAEAEKAAAESKTEPVSQPRPAMPAQPVQLQNQTTLDEVFVAREQQRESSSTNGGGSSSIAAPAATGSGSGGAKEGSKKEGRGRRKGEGGRQSLAAETTALAAESKSHGATRGSKRKGGPPKRMQLSPPRKSKHNRQDVNRSWPSTANPKPRPEERRAIALADSAAVMYSAAKGLLSDALDLAAFCSCDGTADCKGQSAVTSRCRCIPSFALLALLICFAHLLCCSLQSAICSRYGLP